MNMDGSDQIPGSVELMNKDKLAAALNTLKTLNVAGHADLAKLLRVTPMQGMHGGVDKEGAEALAILNPDFGLLFTTYL